MRLLANLILGLLFGFGLLLSGMTDPAKVQNFLDIAGTWDPSLAFVMGGAILVTATGYALVRRRKGPLLEPSFQIPNIQKVDRRLILGSALFGIGWGLGGFCPGPALTSLYQAASGTLVFVPSMLIGIVAGTLYIRMFKSA
ncbi:MAG: DUF6691 family protein [Hyphomicrobium sp.]